MTSMSTRSAGPMRRAPGRSPSDRRLSPYQRSRRPLLSRVPSRLPNQRHLPRRCRPWPPHRWPRRRRPDRPLAGPIEQLCLLWAERPRQARDGLPEPGRCHVRRVLRLILRVGGGPALLPPRRRRQGAADSQPNAVHARGRDLSHRRGGRSTSRSVMAQPAQGAAAGDRPGVKAVPAGQVAAHRGLRERPLQSSARSSFLR